MSKRLLAIMMACALAAPAVARDLEESPAPFSLTPMRPQATGVPLASSLTVPGIAGVPATDGTIAAAAAIAAPAGGITGVATLPAPIAAAPAVGAALANFGGYYYPSNSVLVSYTSDLLANTDGRVFTHPAFPGKLMYWNANEDRWCYQDSRSMSGWYFVPREIYIAAPGDPAMASR